MIEIQDFFDIDENGIPIQKPINRVAFTKADIAYKVKVIQAMQKLGMTVTIDKIGNICGTFAGKTRPDKSIICGSHTDSVDNGGQFDGPLGVFAALKTAEKIAQSGKQNDVNYKAVIYACEESTRFEGKACLGSKYLRGDALDFDTIQSRDGLSLREIVENYKKELDEALEKAGCDPLVEVDKVVTQDEIVTALEGHIEQSDELRKSGKNIGICTSISAPYRLKADITDIPTAAGFICKLKEDAQNPENLTKYRVTVPEFSILSNTKTDLKDKKLLALRCHGENNHSGSTPMNERKDAVYGTAKFIELLGDEPTIQFLQTNTPNWGANQINSCCELLLAMDKNPSPAVRQRLLQAQKQASKMANVTFERIPEITEHDKKSGLFVDVRQQLGMNPKLSCDMIFETIKDIVHKTKCNSYMNITAKGEPYITNLDLIQSANGICETQQIPYKIMPSWPGHDLATLTKNPDARTLLLFCDSTGGSHNVEETTTLDAIKKLVTVESTLAMQELERANQLYTAPQKAAYEDVIR